MCRIVYNKITTQLIMKWYKKQLAEKLKKLDEDKPKTEAGKKTTKHNFIPNSLGSKRNNFVSPVAARNRNRKKTDLP